MKPLWVSLSTYGGVTTSEALQVLWAAGVRHVELAIGVKPSPDTTAALRHYQQQGMHYRAHHALVWEEARSFNLADSFDQRYFERLTDWLAAMNITAYSVHAGSFTRADDPTDAYDRFVTHLEKLRQLCSDRQIRLAVETMYPKTVADSSQYLIQNAAQVDQLLQDMPAINLVLDMAHLHIWKTESILQKRQLLDRFADSCAASRRLLEIHISDNDGQRDSHTTISERTWWLPYAPLFPPDVPIVLESRMNRWSVEQVQQQVQAVQAIVNGRTQP